MDDSMYFIVKDMAEIKTIFQGNFSEYDAGELIGEKLSDHIFVNGFARTKDDQYIVEVPRTLKALQDKILSSPYRDRLKTREDIKNFTMELANGMG